MLDFNFTRRPEDRLPVKIYKSDKQTMLEIIPKGFVNFWFKQIVIKIMIGELALELFSKYPPRPKKNENWAHISPVISAALKENFYDYCADHECDASVIANNIAHAIVDRKVSVHFAMEIVKD